MNANTKETIFSGKTKIPLSPGLTFSPGLTLLCIWTVG